MEFLVWETSLYQTPIGRTPHGPYYRLSDYLYFSWEGGVMANTGDRVAWGASIYFAANGSGTRVALLPRYRKWLRGQLAADFALGPFLLDSHDDAPARLQGAVARGALTFCDLISFSAQLDATRGRTRGWDGRVYAGLRVGSYAAIPMSFFNFAYASVASQELSHLSGSPVP